MRKGVTTAGVAAVLLSLAAASASAGGSWYGFDVTVAKIGRSNTTYNELKTESGPFSLRDVSVGADYRVSVRLEERDNKTLSQYYEIGDIGYDIFRSEGRAGQYVHLRFKNPVTQIYDVNVVGDWSPDVP